MTAEERIAQLEMELARERAKTARVEAELAAHLLRDCLSLHEHEQQGWALEILELLLDMHPATDEWQHPGTLSVPAIEREEWLVRSFEILAAGFAAQPPPSTATIPRQRGRPNKPFPIAWAPG